MPLYSTNDFQPFWGNLWTPPLPFRRRPPQSNCPPGMVHLPAHGIVLEFRKQRGGISRLATCRPESTYHRLPPILCDYFQKSVPGYSKALRGLSVQSRVIRIFTYTTISPGPLLRQRPNRYTFHAGRNLPDKEFRYLRTVIVTAAVHWGLSSMLWIWFLTLPLDLPALGRCQLLYVSLRFRRNLCFW